MCLNFPPQIVLTTSRYTPSISPLNFHLSPTLHIFEFLILFKLLIFLHSPSVLQAFSEIGHANLTKGNDSITHENFLVENDLGVVFVLTRSGQTRGSLTFPAPGWSDLY